MEKEIIKKGEIINFNGERFKRLVSQLELPKVLTKHYLLELRSEGKMGDENI